MSNNMTDEIMIIICAIKAYKEKYQNEIEIERYYKRFGTYIGIADYLHKFIDN